METIAVARGSPDLYSDPYSASKLIGDGYKPEEALEMQTVITSYPHVLQVEWPTTRTDDIPGQHFNLTQLPFDIEVNSTTGFSLDYHIAIYFEQPKSLFSHEEILLKTKSRLRDMKIEVGVDMVEPIAVLCHNGADRTWSGIIKIHLKKPEIDGVAMLRGVRPFNITLDQGKLHRGKVCKTFDPIAQNNLLSCKIQSPNLVGLSAATLHTAILENSFTMGNEFEITQVQKSVEANFAWVVAPTPDQAQKMILRKISVNNEILQPSLSNSERLSTLDKARKNCLIITLLGKHTKYDYGHMTRYDYWLEFSLQ
jgi:hypothetical protein